MKELELHPHQKRVIDERRKLKLKVDALDAFITSNPTFATLSEEEQRILKIQIRAMKVYLVALNHRIRLIHQDDQ